MRVPVIWRFVAATALTTLLAIIVSIASFAIQRPLFIPLLLTLSATSLYGTWLIFTGTRRRLFIGWLLLLGSSLALVSMILASPDTVNAMQLLVTGLLFALYILLVKLLRNKYWSMKRALSLGKNTMATFKKPYLIVNPKSGNGRAIKAGIPEKAASAGIEVKVTTKDDNIVELARNAAKNGADVLGVSGGDGTIGAVATIAIEYDLPLVVLPGGTRCHFARDIGLDPKLIGDALACFYGKEQRIDVGNINGRIFLNNASLGLYADIIDNPEYREHKVATSRATLQKLLTKQKRYPLIFTESQGKKHTEAVQILVGVNAYKTVNLFELGHRDSLTGHTLQITAITQLTDSLVKSLMKTAALNKDFVTENAGAVRQWNTKKFRVDAPGKKIVVGVDGEREEYKTPVTIEVMPGALRLMVLPEGLRQRPKNIFSKDLITVMWRALTGKEI